MKFLLLIVSTLAFIVLPAKAQQPHDLMVINMLAPASLTPTTTSGVIYFVVMNHGPDDDDLLAVSTPRAKAATLHTTIMDGDVMKMRALESVHIPPGGFVKFEAGGQHVMLTGLDAPLKAGEVIQLDLTFKKAGVMQMDVEVGKAAGGHIHGSGN
jgi:periplasmic copper chaperone A